MEPYEQIFEKLLCERKLHLTVLEQVDLEKIITDDCYQIVAAIARIIANDEWDDKDCFFRIEEIIRVLEKHGLDCGIRHDLG